MSISSWIKKNLVAVALATGKVGENSLTQGGETLSNDTGKHQDVNEGTLAHSLINGVVTKEVEELRWRTYKVIKSTENFENENPVDLSTLKVDPHDNYETIMVIDNSDIMLGKYDMANKYYNHAENNEDNSEVKVILDNIITGSKTDKPIHIERRFKPKFEIEQYTKKLVVRKIDNEKRLLEFYISKYPDEYDRKTRFLISEIKRAMNNPRFSDMLDINNVNYITSKDIGVDNNLLYEYNEVKFDKIVEYDGNYVIKFTGTVINDGEDILEKYKDTDLELKYENKEKK